MPEFSHNERGVSPRAAGPAGAQFEVSVGVHYALAVLAMTEAFGLPGIIAKHIAFQRMDQGHPLDDIVLTGDGPTGTRTLEIQAKRSISFTKTSTTFAGLVADMAEGLQIDPQRRFAIAIERTTTRIENGAQEALELARLTSSHTSFFELLNTEGRSNQSMRDFVDAFQHHLQGVGITAPDNVFRHLQSFSILHFDYARHNSVAEHTDRARAAALSQAGSNAYGELFTALMRTDAIGGDLDRQRLIDLLEDRGIVIGGAPCLARARRKIAELSAFALADIDTTIAGTHILRTSLRQKINQQIETARYGSGVLEITGQGGVGKSALLKICAIEHAWHARILILAPDRTPLGGWPSLQHQLDIEATAEEFLLDLACDGGGLVFIDGLDRFRSDGELKTVSDILTVAARTTGVTVICTARPGWEQAHTLSETVIQALKDRERMTIPALDDTEAAALATSVPHLKALLQPHHPAKTLARNPFILKRFAAEGLRSQELLSEASLAWQWWMSGGHAHRLPAGEQLARRRILLSVVEAQLNGARLADLRAEAADANAVASLIADGVLTEISTDRVKFKHDLFTDWSIAAWLSEDIARITRLSLNEAPGFWLARGAELAFRRAAEQDEIQLWTAAITLLQAETINKEWIDLALLALVRSEQASILLRRHEGALLSGKGAFAARLIWLVIGAHSETLDLQTPAPEGGQRPPHQTVALPQVPIWLPLVAWLSDRFAKLPEQPLSACIEMFSKWILLARFGETSVVPVLLDRIADMLIAHVEELDRPVFEFGASTPDIPYRANRDTRDLARFTLAAFADFNPSAATRYLNAIARSEHGVEELHHLLEYPFSLPAATPKAFASALIENTRREYQAYGEDDSGFGRGVYLSSLEDLFVLSKCGICLFHDILNSDPAVGIDIVRQLTKLTEAALETDGHIDLLIAGEERVITPTSSYAWSRGHGPSMMVSKALAALEYWAHEQIEAGQALSDIIRQVAGEGPISGAFLLVIVDITLTHAALNAPELHDLMASPELLALDFRRYQHDYVNLQSGGRLTGSLRSGPETDQAIEASLTEKLSHHVGLHDAFIQVALRVRNEDKQALRARLEHGIQRLGRWNQDIVDWHSPSFMATHALRAIERENYREVMDEAGSAGWQYFWPEDQAAWLEAESHSATKAHAEFNKSLSIRMSMDTETSAMMSTIEDAESILAGTKDVATLEQTPDETLKEARLARIGAAAFLARAYPIEQLRSEGSRLLSLFDEALQHSNAQCSHIRRDVMFDPAALAFTGILYLYRDPASAPDDATLLRLVFVAGASATAALLRHSNAAKLLGEDRINASIRVGLQKCIVAHRRQHEETDDAYEMRMTSLSTDQMTHIQRELAWLSQAGTEPDWFSPPPPGSHWPRKSVRRPNRASKSRENPGRLPHPDVYFDSYAGDEWLKVMKRLARPAALEAMFLANREWLVTANGTEESDTDFERYWSRPLFECAATIAKDWSAAEREDRIFTLLDQLCEKAFLNLAAAFLLESDIRYIEGDLEQTFYLAAVRQRIWQSLQKKQSWNHQQGSKDGRIEIDLHELIATLFIRAGNPFTGTSPYTGGLKQEQLMPFAGPLTELSASAGPCPTISSYFLDYLVSLEPNNACPHLLTVARVWHAQAEIGFWRNRRVGERVCAILEKAHIHNADAGLWQPIASAIVADGVPGGEKLRKRLKQIDEN